ncbi:MAG: WD40 repeat domain-containing protein [bacterium]|nr:WD40 repeat domain-containing protein [bacterium]
MKVSYWLGWNNDESQILTWGVDGTAILWKAVRWGKLQAFSHQDEVNGAAWNNGENQNFDLEYGQQYCPMECVSGQRLQTLSHDRAVWGAIWNTDESQVLTWSDDRTVTLWSAESARSVCAYPARFRFREQCGVVMRAEF